MPILVVSGSDVDQVISKFTPDDLVNLMAIVFSRLSSSSQDSTSTQISQADICLPHRLSVPTTNHTGLFMPSRMTPFGTAIKVVSVPTASAPSEIRNRGLPASTLVFDDHTGEVRAMVNAKNLTALRNAAGMLPLHQSLPLSIHRFYIRFLALHQALTVLRSSSPSSNRSRRTNRRTH